MKGSTYDTSLFVIGDDKCADSYTAISLNVHASGVMQWIDEFADQFLLVLDENID